MAQIEFQVSAPAFLKAQRNALLQHPICPPGPFAVGTAQIVLDRIEFGSNVFVHDVEREFDTFRRRHASREVESGGRVLGFKALLVQPFTIFVTTLDDILSHPNQAPASVVPVQGTLAFEFSAGTNPDGVILLRIEFQPSHSGVSPPPSLSALPVNWPTLSTLIMDEVGKIMPPQSIPIDLGELAPASGFLNAGVSVDTTLSCVALRADTANFDNPSGVWSNFYKGIFDNRLGDNDWVLYLEGKYVGSIIDGELNRRLPELEVPGSLEVIPNTTYTNPGGRAVWTVDLSTTYDLPDPLARPYGHFTVPIEFSLDTPSTIIVDADLSRLPDQLKSFLGFPAGTILSLIDGLGSIVGAPLEEVLHWALGYGLSELGGDAHACEVTPDNHVRCRHPVSLPEPGFGALVGLSALRPLDRGVVLAGSLRTRNLATAVLDIGAQPLKLAAPAISCGIAGMSTIAFFEADPGDAHIIQTSIAIGNVGTAPLRLCSYEIVGDWAHAFPKADIQPDGSTAPIGMAVAFTRPGPIYYNGNGPGQPGHYPCDVLIKTSAGTRLVRLGPAPKIREDDVRGLIAELVAKVGNCQMLVDNWFTAEHGYNPDWHLPDPPDLAVQHLWQFEVAGLSPGEAAALVDTDGNQIVRATAVGDAPVLLTALVAPSAGRRDLSLVRHAAVDGPVHAPVPHGASADAKVTRGIAIGQQRMTRLGTLRLRDRCVDLIAARIGGTPSLVAVLPDSLDAYDVSEPTRPSLAGRWRFPGARGAVWWRGAVMAYGREGLVRVDQGGLHRATVDSCVMPNVLSAAAAGDVFYALTDAALEVYDGRLCRLGRAPLEGSHDAARSIACAGSALAIGGLEGLAVFDSHDPMTPQRRAKAQIAVRRLSTPPMRTGFDAAVVAELEDGSACLLLLDDHDIEEVARYPVSPWFTGCVRLGDLLIRPDSSGAGLELLSIGPTEIR